MRVLQRHYVREFFRLFSIIGLGLAASITALDVMRDIEVFSKDGPPVSYTVYYGLLNLPRYVLTLMPASALLCGLYVVGHAARAKETVAVMAAGGRIKGLLAPFVLVGAALSLFGFVIGEFVVPPCSKAAREIKTAVSGRASLPSLVRDGGVWLRAEDGSLVKVDFFLEGENRFRGVKVFRVSGGRFERAIVAKEALYVPEAENWRLTGVRVYHMDTGEVEDLEEMPLSLPGFSGVLGDESIKPYEMGLTELARYLERLRAAGFKNSRLSVEIHSKLSYPLVNLFMVVLGVSFAARRSMGGPAAAAIGLLVSLLYWLGYTMSLSLGYAGILPPAASAWAMPLAFGAVSAYFFFKIPE